VGSWIKELGKPDIVHWNNGLWDLHHETPMIEALTPLDEYVHTIGRIQKRAATNGSVDHLRYDDPGAV
jgi:hypothetical protein